MILDEPQNTLFQHWNPTTKLCYARKMNCDGCPNLKICEIPPWNINPYRIKNIKYAVIKTLENIGEPK